MQLACIRHLTAVTGNTLASHAFYTQTLGLLLVRIVDQDDVSADLGEPVRRTPDVGGVRTEAGSYSVWSLTRKKSKITRSVASAGTASSTPAMPASEPPARTPRKTRTEGTLMVCA